MERESTNGDQVPEQQASFVVGRSALLQLAGSAFLKRSSMTLPPSMPQQVWEDIGAQLATVWHSSAWWLGDWLIYGETVYSGRYQEAIERTGLDYQTLRNYAWVARRFDHARRRDELSLAHHAEVARLPAPEQDYWLRKAVQEQWSRNRLRKEVRASLVERDDVATAVAEGTVGDKARAHTPPIVPSASVGAHPDQVALELELQPDELNRYVQAAESCGLSVSDWAAGVLQTAAARATSEVAVT
ncbi:MAG: LmbU family transcriptional regulator [Nocardioides sp.]